jgi:hypothetical protein
MTTFNWSVTNMDCYPQAEGQTDVVFQVGWICIGTENSGGTDHSQSAQGIVNVTYAAGSPYTPYANLTQQQVLGWVYASGVDQAATEAQIQAGIDAKINPPVVSPPLPWSA